MTDVFNIDLESDGFRKNNLDWRKFRESYNRVSATKLERGIKPLPFSLLLKLAGPQKVFNTYVISNRTTNEPDFLPLIDVSVKDGEMKSTDMAVTNTVQFPGTGLLNSASETQNEGSKKGPKQMKRDALPVRPAFQRGIRVPGRYFPKPSSSIDDTLSQSSISDYSKIRQRTQTPRSTHTYTPHQRFRGSKVHSTLGCKTPSAFRGQNSRTLDSLSPSTGRTPPWSGVSASSLGTLQSMPILHTNGQHALQATGSSINGNYDAGGDAQFCGLKPDNQDPVNGKRDFETNGEIQSDVFNVKKLSQTIRHVSFPKSSADFSTVLQGRPKTLHKRDPAEEFAREPRARTHVGFAISDT